MLTPKVHIYVLFTFFLSPCVLYCLHFSQVHVYNSIVYIFLKSLCTVLFTFLSSPCVLYCLHFSQVYVYCIVFIFLKSICTVLFTFFSSPCVLHCLHFSSPYLLSFQRKWILLVLNCEPLPAIP